MVGLHLPGDPYFPNQRNAGWLEEEPEEEPEELEFEEEDIDEDIEEDAKSDRDDSDAESEVIDPPYMARVSA